MKRLKAVPLLPALAALLVLLGSPGTGRAAQETVIRFAFQDRIGEVIPIVATRMGFFDDEGLHVEPLRFSSGPACAEALYSGAADIGTMGDTAAVIAVARNPEFVILASNATGEDRHRLMVRSDSKARALKDLKGKRLGVKKGTSTYGGLLAALDKEGLSSDEIDIVDLDPPAMVDALLAGSLDGFVASEPTPSAAETKGARQLMTLGGLGNEYPILIVADRKRLAGREGEIRSFLKALKRAEQYAADHPDETAAIMADETGLSPKVAEEAMKRHRYRIRLDGAILSSLERTACFLQGQTILEELPDIAGSARPDFLESLE